MYIRDQIRVRKTIKLGIIWGPHAIACSVFGFSVRSTPYCDAQFKHSNLVTVKIFKLRPDKLYALADCIFYLKSMGLHSLEISSEIHTK